MDRFTTEERIKIVKTYYKSGDSPVSTFRALRGDFGRHNRPTERTISYTVKKFEETGSVTDMVRPVHHRNVRSMENIAGVSESVAEDPNLSIPRRAQNLGLSYGSLWRILHLDLHLHPYKVQLVQELKPILALLREKFQGRIISRFGDVNWPPRSCDLTPLDFFLWGYAKDRVYVDNPQTLEHLRTNIRQVMAEIQPEMCEKVIENYLKRIESCKKSRGGHLNDIVFHT